jgi:hypothetical protein
MAAMTMFWVLTLCRLVVGMYLHSVKTQKNIIILKEGAKVWEK